VILCLLPVRNGEDELPGWLEAAPAWCDGVVALDDGSTDATRSLLEASLLVRELLTEPARRTAAGWDDGRNRARLFEAAAALRPDWIVWIDADERLAADDAAAMRAFIQGDALPGVAYGFRHCRMWGEDRYDPRTPWVYRLFAWRPDHTLLEERLHFNPLPRQIPRRAWVRTSIRLQHFGAADDRRTRARLQKYAEADPSGSFPVDFGGLDRTPVTLVPWIDRPPDEAIVLPPEGLLGPDSVVDDVARSVPEDERPLVAALLPVRNGERDLAGWFASVSLVADVVVALDDGSTDATRSVLGSEPAVRVLLTRPVRPDHTGWDDAANRRLLLEAAGELRPRWILWLDADERLAPDDALALRGFIAEEAEPGIAYGFRVHRMVGDEDHFDRDDLWVYRLFAWEPGLRFPDERLHFVPVPEQIPPERWLRTTVRIKHLAGLTPEHRRARFQKYREADPELEFQSDYGDLLEAPGALCTWENRPSDLPMLLSGDFDPEITAHLGPHEDEALDLDAPILSAIVISRDDRDRIARTLRSVVSQEVPHPFEVIAVVSGTDGTADVVEREFPNVHLVDLGPGPATPGRARNAGLAVARGDFVSFPGSHIVLPEGSLAARIRAHELGYPMVTGSMRNDNRSSAGWASYFLDHASVLPGSPSGELAFAPPHCSYDRELLMREGGFPEDLRAGEDTVINMLMFARGLRAWRANGVELLHASPCRDLPGLLVHHLRRGRGLGRIMLDGLPPGGRIVTWRVLRRAGFGAVPARIRATDANVLRFGDDELREAYERVRPLVIAGAFAALAGTWWELLRPAPGKLRNLVGVPAVHVAIAGLDRREGFPVGRTDVLLLARIDVLRGRVVLLAPPRDLLVTVPDVGPARLNEAYEHGASRDGGDDQAVGMRCLADTLRSTFGVRVDGTLLVDFEGFVRLVDALGGVDVDVEHDIDDEFTGEDGTVFSAHFSAGPQRMDGAAALVYARTRKADGDRWRRDRHVQLVTSIVRGVLAREGSLLDVASVVRSSIRTDLNPGRMLVAGVGLLRAVRKRAVRTVSLVPPAVRSQRFADRGWVHVADVRAVQNVLRERFLP
jgi:LCP family protein required for cell wall assembly